MDNDSSPWSSIGQQHPCCRHEWPRIYRIVVEGRLDATWSDRLAGMVIRRLDDKETELEGPLRDQAELSGVLNALYDLHLAPLRVELVGKDKNRPTQGRRE